MEYLLDAQDTILEGFYMSCGAVSVSNCFFPIFSYIVHWYDERLFFLFSILFRKQWFISLMSNTRQRVIGAGGPRSCSRQSVSDSPALRPSHPLQGKTQIKKNKDWSKKNWGKHGCFEVVVRFGIENIEGRRSTSWVSKANAGYRSVEWWLDAFRHIKWHTDSVLGGFSSGRCVFNDGF